jgi:hypothetical protein
MGKPFVDFHDLLAKPDTVVVIAKLGKITEGKRERMKDGEGQLGEGGAVAAMSGTVFYKVQASAKLAVEKALCGTSERTLTATFDMQWAKLGSGEVKRQWLLTPRVTLEDDQLALFVLTKDKGATKVTRVVRHDAKAETAEAFGKRVEDMFTINQRMHELDAACQAAQFEARKDKKAAAAALRAVLEKKPKLLLPESDAALSSRAGPFEKRAKELASELDPEPKK